MKMFRLSISHNQGILTTPSSLGRNRRQLNTTIKKDNWQSIIMLKSLDENKKQIHKWHSNHGLTWLIIPLKKSTNKFPFHFPVIDDPSLVKLWKFSSHEKSHFYDTLLLSLFHKSETFERWTRRYFRSEQKNL